MIGAEEEAGLPLIEYRKVVPFVGIMQAINSMLFSESVAHLRRADEASHAMAVELAHGSGLDQILAVLAGILGATLELSSVAGVTLGSAAPSDERVITTDAQDQAETTINIDVPVRGVPSARLAIHVPRDGDVNLARVAGGRCVDILSLALLQRMPPGLKEVAGTALLRAVSSGSQPWRLQQLAPAAGIQASATVVAVVVRSSTSQQLREAMDKVLKKSAQPSASYVDNSELLALAVLTKDREAAARA